MPWNDISRVEYKRTSVRYPSDLTDSEWELIEPFLPAAKSGGRPRTTNLRDVMGAILYMASSGCQWRMLSSHWNGMQMPRSVTYLINL